MTIEGRSDAKRGGRIRLGMVGGGEGAFIGAVHRIAARIDDQYELVAGALSSTPEKARRSGSGAGSRARPRLRRLRGHGQGRGGAPGRDRGGGDRDAQPRPRPAAYRLAQGGHPRHLRQAADGLARRGQADAGGGRGVGPHLRPHPQLHRLSAGPLHAARWCRAGDLGEIRLVQVEYPQDWLTGPTETTGNKQAEWRVDPARSGAGGALGDIGTHAFNLADYVDRPRCRRTVAPISPLSSPAASSTTTSQMLLRYANGARGALWASQVAPGNENGLRLRVYGTKGGLHWAQENPNELLLVAARRGDAHHHPRRPGLGRRGGARHPRARRPSGRLSRRLRQHLFRGRAGDQSGARGQEAARRASTSRPSSTASRALAFVEAAVKSSKANGAWVKPEA